MGGKEGGRAPVHGGRDGKGRGLLFGGAPASALVLGTPFAGMEVVCRGYVTYRAPPLAGEPFGKAGAYAIQGLAGSFVKGIQGCFYSVVGFPVHDFSMQLLRLIDQGHLLLDESRAPSSIDE